MYAICLATEEEIFFAGVAKTVETAKEVLLAVTHWRQADEDGGVWLGYTFDPGPGIVDGFSVLIEPIPADRDFLVNRRLLEDNLPAGGDW